MFVDRHIFHVFGAGQHLMHGQERQLRKKGRAKTHPRSRKGYHSRKSNRRRRLKGRAKRHPLSCKGHKSLKRNIWRRQKVRAKSHPRTRKGHHNVRTSSTGGGEKLHPRQAKFQPSTGGTSVAVHKKKHPKLKKCPVSGVYPGPLLGLKEGILVGHSSSPPSYCGIGGPSGRFMKQGNFPLAWKLRPATATVPQSEGTPIWIVCLFFF